MRRKTRNYDFDDEERYEEESRNQMNQLFLKYVKYVEENWDCELKFDSPYSNLGFFGSPFNNNVFLMPTAFCLTSIIEKPFLVLFLEDIEFVSIERIDNKIKNFDIAIIFKDYTKSVMCIDNIPKDNL